MEKVSSSKRELEVLADNLNYMVDRDECLEDTSWLFDISELASGIAQTAERLAKELEKND